MSDQTAIRITSDDLAAPRVTEYVEAQRFLRREAGEIEAQGLLSKIIYANWFYLALAGLAGALIGWGLIEPFFDDMGEEGVANYLLFPTVGGLIGLMIGAAEGLICRNLERAFKSGVVGLAVGFVGSAVLLIPVGLIFMIMVGIAAEMDPGIAQGRAPKPMAMLFLMMGRGAAWGLIAVAAGAGQGIALRERKVIVNGVVGGLLGGLLGGMLFDPIDLWLTPAEGEAWLSRGVGFAVIGLAVGAFIGLVQGWSKSAWLLMQKGPLAGKQFILFRETTALGSSPKSDVYLFKDDAIEPTHALVINRGGRFEIEDQNTPDGTYVNGMPIQRHVLQAGDQIILGKTVLQFSLKEQAPT